MPDHLADAQSSRTNAGGEIPAPFVEPPPPFTGAPLTPTQEYTRRLEFYEARVQRLNVQHVRLGYVRLLLAASLLVTAWVTLGEHLGSRWLSLLPAAFFAAVAAYHSGILRKVAVAQRSAEVYRSGLARIEDRWAGSNPRDVSVYLPALAELPGSLYAADLDIVGRDGLFELLCTARTPLGEEMLLGWLLEPAPLSVVRERQQAVEELRGRPEFRERMAVAGDAVGLQTRLPGRAPASLQTRATDALQSRTTESLLTWAEAPDVLRQSWWPWLAAALAASAVAGLAVWIARGAIAPLFLVLVLEASVRLPLKREIAAVLDGVDQTVGTMRLVSALLGEMEQETFASKRLQEIQAKLSGPHQTAASAAIATLASLGRYRDSLDNPLIRLLNLPLLYSVQLAFAIQRWRRRHGRSARLWLQGLAEMEALLSLATYSYEHPGDPFPEFSQSASCYEAVDLGHPLLPAARCVRNDVRLGGEVRVLLVSGSNMSGKSTLMRAVGVNAVLAMCGAPVRARSLRMSPMRLGASLLVHDSLKSGQSRFYAEIERLSSICRLAEQDATGQAGTGQDGAGQPGMLFLLDELLQGTNSRDRLIGARGILGALVAAGALGIVTTHDLALTVMEGMEGGRFRNMHFQEQIVAGQMQFDFKMREGVVATSNGIELMRLIGLKV